jgi:hypothetical protein
MIETEVLFAGIAFIIINIVLSFSTFMYVLSIFENKKATKDDYEQLKNALLSMALTIVFSDSIEPGKYNYDEYDGSALPPLSGADLVNAYMSYMTDSANPHIHSKYNAIQRFLHSNIISEQDQETFLANFIEILNSIVEGNYEVSTGEAYATEAYVDAETESDGEDTDDGLKEKEE